MCSYLEWELTVDNAILTNFQAMIKRDHPAHPSRVCSAFVRSTRWSTRCVLTSNGSSPSTTPSSPISRPSHVLNTYATPTMPLPHSRRRPPGLPQPSPPRHPPTARPRDARHALVVQLNLDLPRLFCIPAHPPGIEDNSAQIAGLTPGSAVHHHHHHHHDKHGAGERMPPPGLLSIRTEKSPVVHPLKGKMFAYTIPLGFLCGQEVFFFGGGGRGQTSMAMALTIAHSFTEPRATHTRTESTRQATEPTCIVHSFTAYDNVYHLREQWHYERSNISESHDNDQLGIWGGMKSRPVLIASMSCFAYCMI